MLYYKAMSENKRLFPKGFYWGAATSSYQVEGGIENNDWARSAREAKVPVCGRACDHYHLYKQDFDLAKELGHNAHRFSIEWSRIEPEEGKFDEAAVRHYRKVLEALRARNIEPFVTIWHWTLPEWFESKGGWLHKDAEQHFLRYVSKLATEYKDLVRFWVVYNEPETPVRHGYVFGDRPPHRRLRIYSAVKVIKKIAHVYTESYQTIKSVDPEAQVGFSESLVYFEAYKDTLLNRTAMRLFRWWRNNPHYQVYAENCDFIGLQYYFHTRVRINPFKSRWGIQCNDDERVSDFCWEIYPEGIYHVLLSLKKYNKPVVITENGLADASDTYRADFIREHLLWCHKAIENGVDLRGYLHWSLLDNYEWTEGYKMRFGLVAVNYDTLERKIRPSAYVYKKIIEKNAVEE